MEHSWMRNNFVKAAEVLLTPGGRWHQNRIVWGGDYADEEKGLLPTDSKDLKEHLEYCKETDRENIWVNRFSWVSEHNALQGLVETLPAAYKYLINYDKKEYVDKTHVPGPTEGEWKGWKIHPLPLLTAEGNGRGGGDFRGEDRKELIGRWSRDRIGVDRLKPKGFTELIFDLIED